MDAVPVTEGGSCELCATRVSGQCNKCGKVGFDPHLPYEMGQNGYRSVQPTHYHKEMIVTETGPPVKGVRAQWDEVCADCYKQSYVEIYGTSPF